MLDFHTAGHHQPRALAAAWPCEAGEEWDSGQAAWANCWLCLLDYLRQATSPLWSLSLHVSQWGWPGSLSLLLRRPVLTRVKV